MDNDAKNKRVMGPALPPNFERDSKEPDNDTKQDTTAPVKPARVFGPSLPPKESDRPKERTVRNRSRSRSPPPSANSSRTSSMRESWMTEIGEERSSSKPDPLNIKPRTFIQRRTESYTSSEHNSSADPKDKEKEKQLDEQIKKYNEAHRQKTLQEIYEEEHMGKKKMQTENDMKERIFDWERDMNSTVRQMSSKSAKDLVNKSTLNDRFGSSSSKKYL